MFGDEETFLLGSPRDQRTTRASRSSREQSPLGKAINGKKVGSSAKYSTPSGKTVEVKVLKAAPYTG